MHRHYIFTDKRESKKGILSAMLGAMSLISVFLTVYFTWQNHGTAYVRYGVVTLLCLIFSAAGLVLGIMTKLEEDKFYSLTQKIPPPRERRDFDMFSF